MRFLFFNVVVIAALFMLAMKGGERPESLTAGLKSAEKMVRQVAAAAIGENKKVVLSATGEHVAALPVDAFAKDLGLRPIDPAEFSVKPLTGEEKKSFADEKTQPPPLPAPPATIGTDREKARPHLPKATGRVRVAEGQAFMSPRNRRRELNALARDMESIFLDKIFE